VTDAHRIIDRNSLHFMHLMQPKRLLFSDIGRPPAFLPAYDMGGSVAEWSACRSPARKSTGSNRSRDAVE